MDMDWLDRIQTPEETMKAIYPIILSWKLLIVSLMAQPTNEEVLIQLLRTSMKTFPAIQTIEASYSLPGIENLARSDSSSYTLSLATPTILYRRINRNQYSREIILPVVVQGDQTSHRKSLRYEDEIPWRYMRKLIRTSDKNFRGEDPSLTGKYLIPAAAILIGTGITTGLFYLRSQ